MTYLILIFILLFSVILNYHTLQEYYKIKKRLESKLENQCLEIEQKRFYKKYNLAIMREIEKLRFLNNNMKQNIIKNRSLTNKFKKYGNKRIY